MNDDDIKTLREALTLMVERYDQRGKSALAALERIETELGKADCRQTNGWLTQDLSCAYPADPMCEYHRLTTERDALAALLREVQGCIHLAHLSTTQCDVFDRIEEALK